MSNTLSLAVEPKKEARKITLRRTLYAAGAGLIPIPIADAAALLGIQVFMVRDIARVYDVDFKEKRVKSIITVLVGDVATIGLFKAVPVLGTFLGGVAAAVAGAAATYALGRVFTQHFAQGGTLLDFDPVKSREFFQQEFEKGKQVVADMKNGNLADDEVSDTGDMLAENKSLHAEILALQKQVADMQADKQISKIDLGNLQTVEGIGPKVEAALKAGGISSLGQLAGATAEQLRSILDASEGNFSLAVTDSWPQQAALAVAGDLEGLKSLQDSLTGGR